MTRERGASIGWRWIAGLQGAAGAALIVGGLLANPVLLAPLAADGRISDVGRVFALEGVLIAAGVFLLWRARRVRRERRALPVARALSAMAAMTLGFLFSALAAELFVRVAIDPLRVLSGDAWWEYRWRQSDAARGDEARAGYRFDEFDPIRGWRVRPDFRSEEIRTNSMGARADREYGPERVPGVSRIVAVGDSFTWGEDVANPETFSHRLETQLDATEVMNFGVHGYGTDQQLLALRELGLPLRPDVVLLGLFEENVNRNVLTFRDYAKPRFVLEDGALTLTHTPVPDPETLRGREQALPTSMLAAWIASALGDFVERTVFRTPLAEREELVLTLALLDRAKRESEAIGARFVVLFIPWSNFADAKPVGEAVARWAAESDAEVVDLAERFRALPSEQRARLYVPGGHWTAEGHDVVAGILREHLASDTDPR